LPRNAAARTGASAPAPPPNPPNRSDSASCTSSPLTSTSSTSASCSCASVVTRTYLRDPRCQVTLNRPAEARDLARLAYSSVQPRSEKRGYVELLGTIVDPGWLPTSLTCHRRVCTTSGHYARKSHDRNDRISVRAEPALAGLHQMESGGPQLWRVLANSWRASPVSWVVSTWLMRRAASGRNGTSSSPRT
jgi:hypothetical protein